MLPVLTVQSTMAAEAAAVGPQRIQGPSGARFRGPLAHDDGLLRVQIYTASDVAGGRPTLVRGTTASLDGEIVAFLPEGGGPELQVPRAEVQIYTVDALGSFRTHFVVSAARQQPSGAPSASFMLYRRVPPLSSLWSRAAPFVTSRAQSKPGACSGRARLEGDTRNTLGCGEGEMGGSSIHWWCPNYEKPAYR